MTAGAHLTYAEGARQALKAGAAAVVPKSANETESARRRPDRTGLIGRAADQLGTYAHEETRPDHWKRFVQAEALP